MSARRSPLPVCLTPGEPAGIGPEITAKAWLQLRNTDCTFFLIGDPVLLSSRAKQAGISVSYREISNAGEAAAAFPDALPIMPRPLATPSQAGSLDGANALIVIDAIKEAANLCMQGEAAAMVTNPIQKETLYNAGFAFQGHTDYLGNLAKSKGHTAHDVMMLVAGDLRAVPITVHIPLRDVPRALTSQEIIDQAKIVHHSLIRFFGISQPRIAVTGLNPHAGEAGNMGDEEITIISPAIAALRKSGLAVYGPLPADTAFHPEARAGYDAILCMYHDQALIPAKTLDFHGGVNVTLGLPFIRTSPDHGTALAIAGKGTARHDSLVAAIRLAAQMAGASAPQQS